jgi:transcription antitermination factor NusG
MFKENTVLGALTKTEWLLVFRMKLEISFKVDRNQPCHCIDIFQNRMDAMAICEPPARVTPADLSGDIWLVQTRWRQELSFAAEMAQRGYLAYVPVQQVKRWYPRLNQWKFWESLIFPFYAFIGDSGHPPDETFYAVVETGCVNTGEIGPRRIVDQARVRRELENFEIIHEAGLGWRLQRIAEFKPGYRCRVAAGPLEGLEGIVRRVGKKHRMQIELNVLGHKREVEIDAENLEGADIESMDALDRGRS